MLHNIKRAETDGQIGRKKKIMSNPELGLTSKSAGLGENEMGGLLRARPRLPRFDIFCVLIEG